MPLIQSERLDRWASLAAALILLALACYVYINRYGFLQDPFGDALLWDARVFAVAGEDVARGVDPYADYVWKVPFNLPFITAPLVAHVLGGLAAVLGPALFWLLGLCHFAALVFAPFILIRTLLGSGWTETAFGYALFICGLGAWGVTTIVAGNFGATLYLLIFAAMIPGLKEGKWLWFHIAVAVACQVKPPYALLWALPVLVNGWSWRHARDAAIAAAAAAALYALSFAFDPGLFQGWLNALTRQVQVGDVGFSVYGAVFSRLWPNVTSPIPMIAHIIYCAPLALFLLKDDTKGARKAAALIVFAILANPRMKEYDMAFAAIPAAALYLSAFAPEGSNAKRRALAIGAVLAIMIVMLKADHAPLIGKFIYVIAMTGSVLTLMVKQGRPLPLPASA